MVQQFYFPYVIRNKIEGILMSHIGALADKLSKYQYQPLKNQSTTNIYTVTKHQCSVAKHYVFIKYIVRLSVRVSAVNFLWIFWQYFQYFDSFHSCLIFISNKTYILTVFYFKGQIFWGVASNLSFDLSSVLFCADLSVFFFSRFRMCAFWVWFIPTFFVCVYFVSPLLSEW